MQLWFADVIAVSSFPHAVIRRAVGPLDVKYQVLQERDLMLGEDYLKRIATMILIIHACT